MKKLLQQVAWGVAVGLMVWGAAGCSSREVDTVKLKQAFQSADPAVRAELDKGLAALAATNYAAALPVFKHIAYASKLTKEQDKILVDSIKKLQARVK
jgi:hypothetical protein